MKVFERIQRILDDSRAVEAALDVESGKYVISPHPHEEYHSFSVWIRGDHHKGCAQFRLYLGRIKVIKAGDYAEKVINDMRAVLDRALELDKPKRVWHTPNGEVPDGRLLVEVDLPDGDSVVGVVFISDEDHQKLFDPYTDEDWGFEWQQVSRYALLGDVLGGEG